MVKKASLRRCHLKTQLNEVRERNHVQPWEKKPSGRGKSKSTGPTTEMCSAGLKDKEASVIGSE